MTHNIKQKMRALTVVALTISLAALGGCLLANGLHAEFTTNPQTPAGYPPLIVQFDAGASQSPNGAIVSYHWDFDDGTTGSGETANHTFYAKGLYAVTLTVTDIDGAVGKVTHNVQAMNHFPHPQFTVTPSSLYIPKGQDAKFDGSGSYDEDGSIVDWIWSFGDGTTASGEVVYHAYLSAGSSGLPYTVTLTVIDDDGASNSTRKTVRVVGCDSCE